jgi:uncharacterized cupredoxin-like copper-binding protein
MMAARSTTSGVTLAAVLAIALAIAGGPAPPPASAHSEHAFAAGEPGDPKKPFRIVEVVMTDGPGTMAYKPDRIEVKRGEQVKLVLRNTGQVDHELLIDSFENNARHKKEMEKSPEMEHDEPNGARVKPGGNAGILWRFTKRGTFEFACLIPGHYETGMKGTVIVK